MKLTLNVSSDVIRCPECGRMQCAKVVIYKGDPCPTYLHDCIQCGHTITESEWEPVKSCDKSCGPSDYREWGKCDLNGCFMAEAIGTIHGK